MSNVLVPTGDDRHQRPVLDRRDQLPGVLLRGAPARRARAATSTATASTCGSSPAAARSRSQTPIPTAAASPPTTSTTATRSTAPIGTQPLKPAQAPPIRTDVALLHATPSPTSTARRRAVGAPRTRSAMTRDHEEGAADIHARLHRGHRARGDRARDAVRDPLPAGSALPAWFPILGEDRFELKTELQTAQAVTPGQGQTVNLSGVKVGDVTEVELEDGVAVVTMQVEPEYAPLIHPDASALLRPRTGLQDMMIEVDPGTEERRDPGGLHDPARQLGAERQLRPDPRLARRRHPRLPAAAARRRRRGARHEAEEPELLRRPAPARADDARHRQDQRRARQAPRQPAPRDHQLQADRRGARPSPTPTCRSSSTPRTTVFGAFADSEANIRETLQELPGALRETRGALGASATLSEELEPALDRAAALGAGARRRRCARPGRSSRKTDARDPRADPAVHPEGQPAWSAT